VAIASAIAVVGSSEPTLSFKGGLSLQRLPAHQFSTEGMMTDAILLYLCLCSVATLYDNQHRIIDCRDDTKLLRVGMNVDEVEKVINEKAAGIAILGAATLLDFHHAKITAVFDRGRLIDIRPYLGTTSRFRIQEP
jgi:hypothetical protein